MTRSLGNGSRLFDPNEVRKTLALILPPGQVMELRILNGTILGDSWVRTYTGYFGSHEKLIEALSTCCSWEAAWIVPNELNRALLARACNRLIKAGKDDCTSDNDIVRRRWLLVDADPIRPQGVSSTPCEHDGAIERAYQIRAALSAEGWPEPIVADSGNGGHVMYRIDQPNDPTSLATVKRCLESLSKRFGDKSIKIDVVNANAARAWKLYGTLACKGDSIPERPHRMSRILEAPAMLEVVG